MSFMPRSHAADQHRDRSGPERGVAAVSLIVGGIVLLGAVVAVAYVTTDGFGRTTEPVVAVPKHDEGPDAPVPSTDGAHAADSPMDTAFAARQSVVCTYTHEAYDATATLLSKDVFRIDQQTQGGQAHVIRRPGHTLVWMDGMVEAMEFDTSTYERDPSHAYPTFNPSDFDLDSLFTDGTCQHDSAAADAVFELPADMTSAPATP